MELVAGLVLFFLGASLLAEGSSAVAFRPGRRLVLQAHGFRLAAVSSALGALTGSGTSLTLLGQTLYRLKALTFKEAALLALGGTFGATALVVFAGLARAELGPALLALGLLLDLSRKRAWAQAAYGLGLIFLALRFTGSGASALLPLLGRVGPLEVFMAGLVLTPWVGSANLFALLVLAFTRGTGGVEVSAGALILAAGVGSTGPLFMGGRREGVRLGVAIGLHRLLVATVLFPLVSLRPDPVLLHVGYHLLALILYIPLNTLWEKLAFRFVPEIQVAPKYLRPEALSSPTFARALALMELSRVGDAVLRMLGRATEALAQEEGSERELEPLEEKVDLLSRELLLYAAALEGKEAFPLLMATSEMEHLGDLAKRFLRKVEKLWAQGLTFSSEGQRQLVEAARLILARLEVLNAALATGQGSLAEGVVKGRKDMETHLEGLRLAHLDRLRAGRRESQASTLTHLDLLIILDELDRGVTHIAELVPVLHRSADPRL